MDAQQIIAMMREQQETYARQDNIGAAHTARVLKRLIMLAEDGALSASRPKADFVSPDINRLRERFGTVIRDS